MVVPGLRQSVGRPPREARLLRLQRCVLGDASQTAATVTVARLARHVNRAGATFPAPLTRSVGSVAVSSQKGGIAPA
jgi:hypothetical protein